MITSLCLAVMHCATLVNTQTHTDLLYYSLSQLSYEQKTLDLKISVD